MTYQEGEEHSFSHFLNKFNIFNEVQWTEQVIETVIKQVVFDIANEKIEHAEIKFSIDKFLGKYEPFEIIKLIYAIFQEEGHRWGVKINLVLSIRYECDRDLQYKISQTIHSPGVSDYICGIDLIGDERYFECDFYEGLLKDWKSANKGIEAHVGETQKADNIRYAIERLKVDRIAHGISIIDSPDTIKIAKDNNICFDVAVSSNLLTGVVKNIQEHPVRKMLEQGCIITIGTDDPIILNTTLEEEYYLLQDIIGPNEKLISEIKDNSKTYAF